MYLCNHYINTLYAYCVHAALGITYIISPMLAPCYPYKELQVNQ